MTRAAKIAAIHAQRAAGVAEAESVEAHLGRLAEALALLERTRADLVTRVDPEAEERLRSLSVPLRDLTDDVAREQVELDRVLARLRRTTLNIGVVGRAGQGKSRFLQSLTGLTAQEIPDGSGGFCTGVPSLIRHSPGSDTHADVFFHTESSFLREVIGPYYERLRLGPPPSSLDQFSKPLPELPVDGADDGRARRKSAYDHLAAYQAALPHYRDLLGAPSPLRVKAEEIRQYVAQDDVHGQRRFHAFRTVRRVQITSSFPQGDLEGIGTIDLPGLGDTNLGDSRLLLAALSEDVDVVIFIRRPSPERDGIQDTDTALYDLAQSALPDIPMESRSFFILNRRRSVDQDNLANAEAFLARIPGSALRVAGARIVDCSVPAEVTAAFEPIVDYLLQHVKDLDGALLATRRRRLAEIHRQAMLLVREAATLEALAQPASVWFPAFQELFNAAHRDLSGGLDELVRRYREERFCPDTGFSEAMRGLVGQARENDGIPSPEEIRSRFAIEGSRQAAYSHLLDETRAHLSRHFLALHSALQDRVQQMWQDIEAVLREAGRLAPLSPEPGKAFLLDIAGRVPPAVRPDRRSEIRFALTILAEFDLSYRGFIQHRIRACLDGMHGDTPTIPLPVNGAQVDEATMREMLKVTYEEALDRCDAALNDLLSEPNDAVFAMVEEFRDRVLRSEGAKDEWRVFYQDVRAEIWRDRFSALAAQAAHLRVWNETLRNLTALLGENQAPEGGVTP